MTLQNLYNSLLHVLRKESKGLAVSPDAFSDLLRDENIALFNEYYRGFEATLSVSDALRPFKATDEIPLTYEADVHAQVGDLPDDYVHLTALYVCADKLAFTWDNGGLTGLSPFGQLTYTSTGNIHPLVGNGLDTYEASTSLITTDATKDHVLKVVVTDNGVSEVVNELRLQVYRGTLTDYTEVVDTYIYDGENTIEIAQNDSSMFMVLSSMLGETVDVDIDFDLYEDDESFVSIDIVTDEEWKWRRQDFITAPSANYPIARITADELHVLPKSIDYVRMFYLRLPATPFYDYYIDANYNVQGLAVGATRVLTTGETGRSGEEADETVTSATVEMEWGDVDQIKILNRILAKLGVSMDEQLVAQYAQSKINE